MIWEGERRKTAERVLPGSSCCSRKSDSLVKDKHKEHANLVQNPPNGKAGTEGSEQRCFAIMSPSARSKILAAQKDKLMHKHVQNKPMTSVLRQPLEGFYLPGAQDTGTFLQSHLAKDEIAFQNHRFTIGNAEVVETHRRHYSSLQAARNTLQTKAPEQNLVLPREPRFFTDLTKDTSKNDKA
mmetsp:Transcript_15872/g.18381  ORF Transcript_15872/g.18381 Transcript_15872/m.18381 type:complete len:183 (+) Transcript_15872:197-745(+)|eukprot:CAMPEP_0168336050 /NCGR_PEP_ID=MMETSP0213-20121227/11297_1 /TAXON_ID=151035 /ORGANISM="Euplotes harpa, Strain FSP1.4" /LENGTH=182 /DNA_ID=CAMNT_0008341141 /DNA_START=194 /DNA_END=742 /DNA_ORIENTATION=+